MSGVTDSPAMDLLSDRGVRLEKAFRPFFNGLWTNKEPQFHQKESSYGHWHQGLLDYFYSIISQEANHIFICNIDKQYTMIWSNNATYFLMTFQIFAYHALFWDHFSNIKVLACFCLQILNVHSDTPRHFPSFSKKCLRYRLS